MVEIKVELTNLPTSQLLTVTVTGHAFNREDCARVTASFDMFTQMLYNNRVELIKKSGYSQAVFDLDTEDIKTLALLGLKGFKDLSRAYHNTTKFTFKEG